MILEFSSIISILISLLIINGLFNLAEIIKPIKKKFLLKTKNCY